MKYDYRNRQSEHHSIELNEEILIKPRPANEMELLEKWCKNTPGKLFPEVDGNSKIPHDLILQSSGRNDIVINGKKYDPWLFIRLGNRKPSDPNNPTTLDGWRKLEASLIPSTMRDEVRLTRLQLEYYSAKEGTDTENAKNELAEWLKDLPEPQRSYMLAVLVDRMNYYSIYLLVNSEKPTPPIEKYRELMRTLFDLITPQGTNPSSTVLL